jgi:hypothetical protein
MKKIAKHYQHLLHLKVACYQLTFTLLLMSKAKAEDNSWNP